MSKLAHTLLFFIREQYHAQDIALVCACLGSLAKGGRAPVIIYNQGCLCNEQVHTLLGGYDLETHIIGSGENTGTTVGRQACFEYIWNTLPDIAYISELHPDMLFTPHWADILCAYLDANNEPMISSGIINNGGVIPFSNRSAPLPSGGITRDFLEELAEDRIVHGFNNPCVHRAQALRAAGGYNPRFLTGKSCFEDDSMLLGYLYYCGIQSGWRPKVNLNAMVYHATAGQRVGLGHNQLDNFNGLVRQYGAMGLLHLSELHQSTWHQRFFSQQYESYANASGMPTA